MIKKYLFCTITSIILVTVALTGLISCGGGGGSSVQPPPNVIIEPPPVRNRAPTLSDFVNSSNAINLNAGSSQIYPDISPWFSDPDGDSLEYEVTSDDRSVATGEISGDTGDRMEVTAQRAGQAVVTVTATDPSGLTASISIRVTVSTPVQNRAPNVQTSDGTRTLDVGQTHRFPTNIQNWFSDPDGDLLEYSVRTTDTSVATGDISDNNLTITAHQEGQAIVTVTATDPSGLTASVHITVTVNQPNGAPWVTPRGLGGIATVFPIPVGDTLSDNVQLWFTDPDGDLLEYSVRTTDTSVATGNISGSNLTITAHQVGEATITVTATDPGGLTASVDSDISVVQPNRAPNVRFSDDTRTVDIGQTITGSNIENWFSDPDGDSLEYSVRSTAPSVATGEISGSNLTITAHRAGQATVTVAATDPGGLTASIDITVTVNQPTPPKIVFETDDGCNDGIDVEMRFSYEEGDIFRGWATDVKLARGSDTTTTVSCDYSNVDQVCYGARLTNPHNGQQFYWGQDIDRSEECDDCCVTCPESGTQRIHLVFLCPN